MEARYTEFRWKTSAPGNGESGKGLADQVIHLVKTLADGGTICDLGCGNGYLAGRLAEVGYEVVGMDGSASGIAVARQTYESAIFIQDIIDAGIATRTRVRDVDLVVSSDVIEHLYRPLDLIEAAWSLLKPGGYLVITTPYHGYWKNLALSVTGRMDNHLSALDDGGHIKFFSVKTLSALLVNYGFAEISFSFYGRAPWLWKNMICHARKK